MSGGRRGVPKIARAALESREHPPELIRSSVEEQVVAISSRVERRVPYFATIGNVATLVGLMGTIYGLVLAFVGFQSALRRRDWPLVFGVPVAIASMHLSWGVAFLWSFLNTILRRAR